MNTELCSLCGKGEARETTGTRKVVVDGKTLRLQGDRFMYCSRCRTRYYTGQQARESFRRLKELREGTGPHEFVSRQISLGPFPLSRIGLEQAKLEQASFSR